MVVRLSTVFLAKRDTDFAKMRSISSASATTTMDLKPSRCLAEVPVMPSSVYTSAYSHSEFACMSALK